MINTKNTENMRLVVGHNVVICGCFVNKNHKTRNISYINVLFKNDKKNNTYCIEK